MYDLDGLIASSGLRMGNEIANINDLGEIAGNATDPKTFLARRSVGSV
jgi:hypothetical protein